MRYLVKVNGKQIEVEIEKIGAGGVSNAAPRAAAPSVSAQPEPVIETPQVAGVPNLKVESPMPGSIFKVEVEVGQAVEEGQVLIILEAMKMENELVAPRAGIVKQILFSPGASVNTGDALVVLS